MILISVIIPVFNNINTISRAIESVLDQKLAVGCDLECIVVDDGSTEDIQTYVKSKYPNILYIFKLNGGAASARNVGLRQAKGDFIFFLDSDDQWLPDKLSYQLALFQKYPKVVLISGRMHDFNIENNKIKHRKVSYKGDLLKRLAFYNPIATSTVGLRSSIIKDEGLSFSETKISTQEDWLLWFRISARGDILVSDRIFANRFLQKTSLSAEGFSVSEFAMQRERIQALIKKDIKLTNAIKAHSISEKGIEVFRKAIYLKSVGRNSEASRLILSNLSSLPLSTLWFQISRILLII